jgi:HSP20 family molecular chaperone IbpA
MFLTKYRPKRFFQLEKTFDPFLSFFEYQRDAFISSSEDDKSIEYNFTVPGFEATDLKVVASNNELSVSAQSSNVSAGTTSKSVHLKVNLPQYADVSQATSKYKSGILTVKIGKLPSATNEIEIPVES